VTSRLIVRELPIHRKKRVMNIPKVPLLTSTHCSRARPASSGVDREGQMTEGHLQQTRIDEPRSKSRQCLPSKGAAVWALKVGELQQDELRVRLSEQRRAIGGKGSCGNRHVGPRMKRPGLDNE